MVSKATMPFLLRTLRSADVGQSMEIERDAFPTLFPPTSFGRELKNRNASYLVACSMKSAERGQGHLNPTVRSGPSRRSRSMIGDLVHRAGHVWKGRNGGHASGQDFIAGFLGIWYMVDEAHIISVGVRRGYRGQGIGELLLIGAIERAIEHNAAAVTLEVRPSNHVARNLYEKYGFTERGLRKAYYADNREDALIMTTDAIHASSFTERFRRLRREHERRWGQAGRRFP